MPTYLFSDIDPQPKQPRKPAPAKTETVKHMSQRRRQRDSAIPYEIGDDCIEVRDGFWYIKPDAANDISDDLPAPGEMNKEATPEALDRLQEIVSFGADSALALQPFQEKIDDRLRNAMRYLNTPVYVDERQEAIFKNIPEDRKIYTLLIAYYDVQRRNIGRLVAQKTVFSLVALLIIALSTSLIFAPGLFEGLVTGGDLQTMAETERKNAAMRMGSVNTGLSFAGATGALLLAVIYWASNNQALKNFRNASRENANVAANAVSDLEVRFRQVEQDSYTMITNAEQELTGVAPELRGKIVRRWSILAEAAVWRLRLLRAFADVAPFKIRRAYVEEYGLHYNLMRWGTTAVVGLGAVFVALNPALRSMLTHTVTGMDPAAMFTGALCAGSFLTVLVLSLSQKAFNPTDIDDLTNLFISNARANRRMDRTDRHTLAALLVVQAMNNRFGQPGVTPSAGSQFGESQRH